MTAPYRPWAEVFTNECYLHSKPVRVHMIDEMGYACRPWEPAQRVARRLAA